MTGFRLRGLRIRGAARTAAPCGRPGPRRRFACGALLLLSFAGAGCYSYSVIDPAQADPGLDVRARITPAESARLEEQVGLRERVIRGEVVDAGSAGLVLSIPTVLREPGTSTSRLHRRITLSNAAIVELEQRRLSRWRTFSLVGIAAVVAGYVVVSQFGGDEGDPSTDKPIGGNRVPSIPVGVP